MKALLATIVAANALSLTPAQAEEIDEYNRFVDAHNKQVEAYQVQANAFNVDQVQFNKEKDVFNALPANEKDPTVYAALIARYDALAARLAVLNTEWNRLDGQARFIAAWAARHPEWKNKE